MSEGQNARQEGHGQGKKAMKNALFIHPFFKKKQKTYIQIREALSCLQACLTSVIAAMIMYELLVKIRVRIHTRVNTHASLTR